MPDLARLAAAARTLLPPGAGVAARDPRADHPAFPGEGITAIPSRNREFRAGRAAARAAMAALGLPQVAIPMRPDRAPDWPPGLSLSITHSASACLAAVLPGARGLGLNIEPDRPLPPDLWETVLSATEQATHGPDAMAVFAAKEAAYKAQYPVSEALFDFQTLAIVLTPGAFRATFCLSVPGFPAGSVIAGRWSRAEGHILAAAVIG